jgi:O-antigen/teichoic acid export membrane protein
MPAALLGAAVSQIATLLILFFFDSEVLGIYSQAVAVLFIPLSQIGAAVSQVFFVRAAEAQREGSLGRLTYTIHRRLVAMALFPAAVAMLAGGDIFEFLFGATWRPSGEYLIYLAPWIFLSSIASPLTRLFDVLEKQKLELAATAAMLVVVVLALWAGGSTGRIELTMLFLGAAGSAVRAGQIVLLLKLAGLRPSEMTEPYGLYLAYAAVPLGLVGLVIGTSDSLLLTFGAAAAAGLMYGAVVVTRDRLLARRR